jgi:hypothetical protein
MTQLVTLAASNAPPLITAAGDRAAYRFLEFLTAQIRNPHTRRAYVRAVGRFCAWLEARGVPSIAAVGSIHVAAYVEELGHRQSAPTVKQHLAAIRMIFDWLATGGTVGDPDHGGIAVPVAVLARRGDQALDFVGGQVFAGAARGMRNGPRRNCPILRDWRGGRGCGAAHRAWALACA